MLFNKFNDSFIVSIFENQARDQGFPWMLMAYKERTNQSKPALRNNLETKPTPLVARRRIA